VTFLIHYSQIRETPWCVAWTDEKGTKNKIYVKKVYFDVSCKTFEDYDSKQKTWCYIEANGQIEINDDHVRIK
jgi:hypothetical protein